MAETYEEYEETHHVTRKSVTTFKIEEVSNRKLTFGLHPSRNASRCTVSLRRRIPPAWMCFNAATAAYLPLPPRLLQKSRSALRLRTLQPLPIHCVVFIFKRARVSLPHSVFYFIFLFGFIRDPPPLPSFLLTFIFPTKTTVGYFSRLCARRVVPWGLSVPVCIFLLSLCTFSSAFLRRFGVAPGGRICRADRVSH
uniref:Transmembrane protein n=1 Tax=Anopheles melas TaxID=34690 RepID=A0A182U1P7_9DIPT